MSAIKKLVGHKIGQMTSMGTWFTGVSVFASREFFLALHEIKQLKSTNQIFAHK
jgi:hypothetical protein